jgi:hypothetical protein
MTFQPRQLPQSSSFSAAAFQIDLPSIALVMPCYNKAKRLDTPQIDNYLFANPGIHLILVNDGSKDKTLDLLVAMQRLCPRQIIVLDLSRNSGKAEAVRLGLLHARLIGADVTGYWDADLATPLEAIADFAPVAGPYADFDVIFGPQHRMPGHRIERTLARRVVSRLCRWVARLALELPIADPQCGAKRRRNTDALRAALTPPHRSIPIDATQHPPDFAQRRPGQPDLPTPGSALGPQSDPAALPALSAQKHSGHPRRQAFPAKAHVLKQVDGAFEIGAK